ncbi:unnamed protein product [Amoebophrya sp. A25]|nr:unnamed protein product [Amoebophrya sp. A25]|eukprot:GSA25T00008089001.1
MSNVYILLFAACFSALRNLGELGGKWQEILIVFGQSNPEDEEEGAGAWVRLLLRMLDTVGAVSVQLPWSLEVDYRVLALENWDLLTNPDCGGDKNRPFPQRSDTTVKICFLNTQLKVRSVPKAFELYHKYVYFQHTDNLVSPEMVLEGNPSAEQSIRAAALSPIGSPVASGSPVILSPSGGGHGRDSPNAATLSMNLSNMSTGGHPRNSPTNSMNVPMEQQGRYVTAVGGIASPAGSQTAIAGAYVADGRRSPTTRMRPDLMSELSQQDAALLSEGVHRMAARDVEVAGVLNLSSLQQEGSSSCSSSSTAVQFAAAVDRTRYQEGELAAIAASDAEQVPTIPSRTSSRFGALRIQTEQEGSPKQQGTTVHKHDSHDPGGASSSQVQQLDGAYYNEYHLQHRRMSPSNVAQHHDLLQQQETLEDQGQHQAGSQRAHHPTIALAANGRGNLDPDTTEFVVGRPSLGPSTGGSSGGGSRGGHLQGDPIRDHPSQHPHPGAEDLTMMECLQAEIQDQMLLRFRVRLYAKILASLLLFAAPLIWPATTAEHSVGLFANHYRISRDEASYLLEIDEDSSKAVLESPLSKIAFVGGLVYALLDVSEWAVLTTFFPQSDRLQPRNIKDVEASNKALHLGMLSFAVLLALLFFHVSWNPFNVELLRRHVEHHSSTVSKQGLEASRDAKIAEILSVASDYCL